MQELNLKEIQQAELENLISLDRICKSEGFTYYLAYGTLIGAIRNKGFIPWDDDTDVWMPRSDYDRFIEYCQSHAKELGPLKLCTRVNTPKYPYGIARLSDTRYKYVTINSYEEQFELGVFTDIYPLDNMGNDDNIDRIKKLRNYNDEQNIAYTKYCSRSSTNKLKGLLKSIRYMLLHLIHGIDYSNYAKKINNNILGAIEKYTSSDDKYMGLISWNTTAFRRYRKSDFSKSILVDFENKKLPAPVGYDRILRQTYGDYMKLPPESERHPQHGYKIFKK